MSTEVALGRSVGLCIDIDRIVRARLHAAFAADALSAIEIDDSVLALEERCRRTNLYARGVSAVVASQDSHFAAGVRVGALFDVLDPRTKLANGDVVLCLARDGTGVASDAGSLINREAVLHVITCP